MWEGVQEGGVSVGKDQGGHPPHTFPSTRTYLVVCGRVGYGFSIDVAVVEDVEVLESVDDFGHVFANQSLIVA